MPSRSADAAVQTASETPSSDGLNALRQRIKDLEAANESATRKFDSLEASYAKETQKVNFLEQQINNMKQALPEPGASTRAQPATASSAPPPRRGRNLVVCIDGTSNQFSAKNTNVVELYHRLIRDKNQLTFYNSGIGTYATPSWRSWKYFKQVLGNKIDLAIAWKFEKILLSAYQWLSENYEDGDVIYLFGFSRGAYQIRTLSAMIDLVGLLRKGNLDQIPFAYELYAETKKSTKVHIKLMCQHFKETFSEKDVKVYFAGAWDTVSSVGFIRNKTLPGTTDGMKHVVFFRHALALHERRVKFLQENVRGGLGPEEAETSGRPPHTKEVWFAGSHGDIGGGAILNLASDQFGPALRWMLFEAAVAGLRLTDAPQKWETVQVRKVHNTLKGFWWILEYIPFTRLTYNDSNGLTAWPHRGLSRKIKPGQLIHATARESPALWRAQLPDGTDWNDIPASMFEEDPYSEATGLLARIQDHTAELPTQMLSDRDITALKILISTEPGQRSLRDSRAAVKILMTLLEQYPGRSEGFNIVADAALSAMNPDAINHEEYALNQLLPVLARARETRKYGIANLLEEAYAPAQVHRLEHPEDVHSVAYMPEGDSRVVSGCVDHVVRIWDLKTGEIVGAPMTGNTDAVWCVTVSDGETQIASGSRDGKVRVWNAGTGETLAVLEGHGLGALSVAFSPDGTRVASGSNDNTIRVWDVASAKIVVGPIKAHSDRVGSVAYSPDGLRIASGADDETVRVWDAETGQKVWWEGMGTSVNSVAYSHNGKRIAAGCDDRSVYVLDAETGKIVLEPLTGHTSWVNSVAFSPDGKKIASASDDNTVRIWDAETGAMLDVLRGHRNFVRSVAFSPDGKHVASASDDKTVRIWDATSEWKQW